VSGRSWRLAAGGGGGPALHLGIAIAIGFAIIASEVWRAGSAGAGVGVGAAGCGVRGAAPGAGRAAGAERQNEKAKSRSVFAYAYALWRAVLAIRPVIYRYAKQQRRCFCSCRLPAVCSVFCVFRLYAGIAKFLTAGTLDYFSAFVLLYRQVLLPFHCPLSQAALYPLDYQLPDSLAI
jgi:hypothetical protein